MEKEKLDEIYAEMKACIEGEGYECAGFELVSESGMNILRAYIDMPGGVDLMDCETVARVVTEYLDTVESSLPDRYYLEVSSLGIERPLFCPADYAKCSGKWAEIKLVKNSRNIQAELVSATDEAVTVRGKSGAEKVIPFSEIKKAHILYVPEKGKKKTFKKTGKA